MNRLVIAGLLALPALLAAGSEARAHYPCPYMGCGGFCFKFLGGIHQHGPLYNYGPYTGYYPFEPYGPWDAQLQYTGPRPGDAVGCGWNRLCGKCGGKCGADGTCGSCGHRWGHHGGGCDGCSAWGKYAKTTFTNVGHRVFPLFHKYKGCGGCDACGSWPTFALAEDRAVVPPAESIQQAGYPRTER